MTTPLVRKLKIATDLTDEDQGILERLCEHRREVASKQDLIRQGDRPEVVHLVLNGMACRYKLMPGGRRQIVALLLPGDFLDLHTPILGAMDHSVATLTPCTIVEISAATIHNLARQSPNIMQALWWASLVDGATLREWLASQGQRDAVKRMAHFFCELLERYHAIDLVDECSFPMPLTQVDLGDLLGLTPVHVNRMLQELREAGLIVLTHRRLRILDVDQLKALCSFNPDYLHLSRRL